MSINQKKFAVFYLCMTVLQVCFTLAEGFYFCACQGKTYFKFFLDMKLVVSLPVSAYRLHNVSIAQISLNLKRQVIGKTAN